MPYKEKYIYKFVSNSEASVFQLNNALIDRLKHHGIAMAQAPSLQLNESMLK